MHVFQPTDQVVKPCMDRFLVLRVDDRSTGYAVPRPLDDRPHHVARIGPHNIIEGHPVGEERYATQLEQIFTDAVTFRDFESLTSSWNAVTLALNSLSRSMGLKDAYPFVLSAKVLEKLRFVHDLIQTRRAEQKSGDLRATG
jgi:hypothetical protein